MKKLIFMGMVLYTLSSCQDKSKLAEVKEQAFNEGYQRAMKDIFVHDSILMLSKIDTSLAIKSLTYLVPPHPPADGHIHNGSLTKTSKPLTGKFVISDNRAHVPTRFVSFINPLELELLPTDDYRNIPSHRHIKYTLVTVEDYNSAGNVKGTYDVAVITAIIP